MYAKFFKKSKTFNIAAGAKIGEVAFHEASYLAGSSINLDTNSSNLNRLSISVPITTLDEFIGLNYVSNLKLVKVDVEGFELDVLSGSINIIKKYNPIFVCEFNLYALSANGNISPFIFLKKILNIYGKFYGFRNNKSICIENDEDAKTFFYQNMVMYGCVEDIYFGGDYSLPN